MFQRERRIQDVQMMRLFILLTTLYMLSGCRSVKYIPVETIKTDSIYFNKIMHDSIIVKDSIYIKEKGDKVYQYKDKYIYKYKSVHDTLYIERTDSIRVPYPVEANLTKWQKIKIEIGGYVLAIGLFIILFVVGRHIIKLKK